MAIVAGCLSVATMNTFKCECEENRDKSKAETRRGICSDVRITQCAHNNYQVLSGMRERVKTFITSVARFNQYLPILIKGSALILEIIF